MWKPLLAAAAAALALAACSKKIEAPYDTGVCWHAVPQKDGTIRFNRLVGNIPNIETCAANLEAMRLKFLSMGGAHAEIMGGYQGQFIFIQREGVFIAPSLNAARFPALVRTDDGRLAVPGAIRRAVPEMDGSPAPAS